MENFDIVLKMCGVGVVCSVCLMILPPACGGVGTALRIGGGVLLFASLLVLIGRGAQELRGIVEGASISDSYISEAFSLMLKGLGIAFLTKLCSDVCRDCGESRIADTVEGAGRVAIFLLTVPTFSRIIQYTEEILNLT